MTNTDDWELDRLPAIKEELKEHGYVCYDEKHVNTSYSILSCGVLFLAIIGVTLIGAGIAANPLLGAGLGLIGASLFLGWRWHRGYKKLMGL